MRFRRLLCLLLLLAAAIVPDLGAVENSARQARRQLVAMLTGAGLANRDAAFQANVNALISQWSLVTLDPATFGLVNNATGDAECSITSGAATLTSPNNPWAATDVGRVIYVEGAGAGGATLKTIITGFTNAGTITLRDNAGTTVTSSKTSTAGLAIWGDAGVAAAPTTPVTSGGTQTIAAGGSGDAMNLLLTAAGTTTARALGTRWAELSYNVNDFGAVADNTTDDAAAFQRAINACVAAGGGTVFIPAGQYKIATMLTISGSTGRINIMGVGPASRLNNNVVGATADPMLRISAQTNYFIVENLEIDGNNATDATGNGHAIACINDVGGATFWPQQVMIRDCVIRTCRGTGKRFDASGIPACAVYAYLGTALYLDNCTLVSDAMGVRFDAYQKAYIGHTTFETCDKNAVYIANASECISVTDSTLNQCGAGGATDGLVYVGASNKIGVRGCRLKNGYPYNINLNSTTEAQSKNVNVIDCDQQMLDPAYGHTAVCVSSSLNGMVVEGNRFGFVNTIADGVGIDVTQGAGGNSAAGYVFSGNTFTIGSGGTIAACIRINVSSNRCYSPVISGNVFGQQANFAGATTMTAGVLLDGRTENAVVMGNEFAAATNLTITDAIRINSANVINTSIVGNSYGGFGTITNQVNNAGAVTALTRMSDGSGYLTLGAGGSSAGILRVLSATATWDPASVADGAMTSTTITVTGAAIGNTVDVGFSQAVPAGMILSGNVTSSNTVTVTLFNKSGGAVDLASGTLRATVLQY